MKHEGSRPEAFRAARILAGHARSRYPDVQSPEHGGCRRNRPAAPLRALDRHRGRAGSRAVAIRGYPLTAPAVRPLTIWRWNTITSRKSGAVMETAAATASTWSVVVVSRLK